MARSILVRAWAFALLAIFNGSLLAVDIDFAHDIFPILKSQCSKCHGGEEREGEFSLNNRDALLKGGEHGAGIRLGDSKGSLLIHRITTSDSTERMPPEGEPLTAKQIQKLSEWIESGAKWDEGLTFAKSQYDPPLRLNRPELPAVQNHEGIKNTRTSAIDRFLDETYVGREETLPPSIDDSSFARRAWLDLNGLLPPPQELVDFLGDTSPNKRARLVRKLLDDKRNYAEHWLTFWNDLLRNDYGGTGFITGGRKQISVWLYRSLIENKPYDQMARELIAPTEESTGFVDGIRWRGTVSAGQTVEIQFAQSVGQSFLGINLKCASCHDSFIDRWKLEDSYGLAAIYSKIPLEIHRCDKPVGKQARAAWLFPEIGEVDATLDQPARLKQLSQLMTHRDNGLFARTMVNRLWHRLMGRGIVEPVDAMQSKPWNEELLEWLAFDFVEHGYDLKHTMETICNSEAYQSRTEIIADFDPTKLYVYSGPRPKRMTAEQFVDCVWQLTEYSPTEYDAPILRGELTKSQIDNETLIAKWIWSRADAEVSPANEQFTFRKVFELGALPKRSTVIATCGNSFDLFVNGKKIASGDQWDRVRGFLLNKHLSVGKNELLLVGKNGGESPNPAGAFVEIRIVDENDQTRSIGSDATWEWTSSVPEKNGKFKKGPDWTGAFEVSKPEVWMSRIENQLRMQLATGMFSQAWMVRSSLLKSDSFQKTLGRPNRDQIVTSRPATWSTLEALDLNNAQVLDYYLAEGAKFLFAEGQLGSTGIVERIYRKGLSRLPNDEERRIGIDAMGSASPSVERIQDFLWTIVMLPEFQIIR